MESLCVLVAEVVKPEYFDIIEFMQNYYDQSYEEHEPYADMYMLENEKRINQCLEQKFKNNPVYQESEIAFDWAGYIEKSKV